MKNMLQVAALLIMTALAVLAAARYHGRVQDSCEREERVIIRCVPSPELVVDWLAIN